VVVGQFVESRVSVHLLKFCDGYPSPVLIEGLRILAVQLDDASDRLNPSLRYHDFFFAFLNCKTLEVVPKDRYALSALGIGIFVAWWLDRLAFHEYSCTIIM
jgi:hypothetical protein